MRIIDTSAIMDVPSVVEPRDPTDEVVIPSLVVTELDYHKDNRFKSSKARAAIRAILGVYSDPRVSFCTDWAGSKEADDQIIDILRYWGSENGVVVTNDLALQIRTLMCGREYESCTVKLPDITEEEIDAEYINFLHKEGRAPTSNPYAPNECVLLRASDHPTQTCLAMGSREPGWLERVNPGKFWDVRPKGLKQAFLGELLTDPKVEIMTVVGAAGSGKTYLTLAAALDQVFDKRNYRNIVVTRPIVAVGKDLGFLPGTVNEKTDSWYGPIDAIIKELVGPKPSEQISRRIQRLPLPYVRGYTVKNAFWLVDEAQNYSTSELRTLLTRAGAGTKVVLTSDMTQSDRNVGHSISDVVRAFHGETCYGHIALDKIYRGRICEIAAERL